MSNFTKKYYSPKDETVFLVASWELGYKNLQIFSGERLIHTIKNPGSLMKGVTIHDHELGKLKFAFTTTRPRKLEIKAKGKKYKTINKLNLGYDYTGLIAIFSSLALIAAMGLVIILGTFDFDFSYPPVPFLLIADITIIAIYVATAYALSKKKPVLFFVGALVFLLTTAMSLSPQSIGFTGVVINIMLIFRIGILIYFVTQVKHILEEIKKPNSKAENSIDLLDN